MPKQKDRIIIDTNLWLSFLITKDNSGLDWIFSEDLATLLYRQELIDEFIAVARRPKPWTLYVTLISILLKFKQT